MKLIITQPEIESIVRAHVENTVQLREGAEMKIDFTATRSDDGITATIDIPYLGLGGIPAIAQQQASAVTSIPAVLVKQQPNRATRSKSASPASPEVTKDEGETPSTEGIYTPEDAPFPADAAEPASEPAAETPQGAQEPAAPVSSDSGTPRSPSLFSGFMR